MFGICRGVSERVAPPTVWTAQRHMICRAWLWILLPTVKSSDTITGFCKEGEITRRVPLRDLVKHLILRQSVFLPRIWKPLSVEFWLCQLHLFWRNQSCCSSFYFGFATGSYLQILESCGSSALDCEYKRCFRWANIIHAISVFTKPKSETLAGT